MITKIIFKIFLLIVSVFFIVSCSNTTSKIDEVYTITEPIYNNGFDDNIISGVNIENDYTNFNVYTDKEIYSDQDEFIDCIVENNNVGKAFYFYTIPFVEKQENDDWINVVYKNSRLLYESNWALCYIENNTTIPNSTIVRLPVEYIKDKLVTGRYRLVVFVGNSKVYAPFSYQK